jgi:NADPH:quinone reductase-like Zn-dependent oxidoreductase
LVDVTTAALERIAGMIDAGEIATSVGAVLSLAELRTAHEMVEGMRTRPRGKIVLKS